MQTAQLTHTQRTVYERRFKTLEEIAFEDHDRLSSIGGSEIAACAGMHEYQTAYKLWAVKSRLLPADNLDGVDSIELGRAMEPVILDRYLTKTKIERDTIDDRVITYRHPLLWWITFSPDAIDKQGKFGLEIKFVGYRTMKNWGVEGTDQIPAMYLAQVAWGSILLRIPVWYIIACFGTEMRVYVYRKNIEFEKLLLKKARHFWNINVKRNIAPRLQGSQTAFKNDSKTASLIYYRPKDIIKQASGDEFEMMREYPILEANVKKAEAAMQDARANLKARIGNNYGISDGANLATWKPTKKNPRERRWGWKKEKK